MPVIMYNFRKIQLTYAERSSSESWFWTQKWRVSPVLGIRTWSKKAQWPAHPIFGKTTFFFKRLRLFFCVCWTLTSCKKNRKKSKSWESALQTDGRVDWRTKIDEFIGPFGRAAAPKCYFTVQLFERNMT